MTTDHIDEIVLVRHGQTEWSRSGRHTGRTDVALTELGRRQADALAGMLGPRSSDDVVWSSPLARARETMERAGLASGAHLEPDLAEWDYGAYEGARTLEVRTEIPGWSVWSHPIVDGESVDDVGARVDRVIATVAAEDGRAALFAHGHLLRILASRWIGLAPATGQALALETATICRLGHERERRVITGWNERCHLRSLDPPA